MLDHRNARLTVDALNQALATARHDHVDVLLHGDQFAHRGAVGGLDHLHGGFGQTGFAQALAHAGGDRPVRANGLRAAAQNASVTALQTQTGGVRRHVRPRLVDDADDTQRHAHAAHLDARRPIGEAAHLAHGIGQGGDLLEAGGHVLNALRSQREAVDHRCIETGGLRSRHIVGVGAEQRGRLAANGGGHDRQCAVLGIGVGARQGAARLAGGAAQALHVSGDVSDVSHGAFGGSVHS